MPPAVSTARSRLSVPVLVAAVLGILMLLAIGWTASRVWVAATSLQNAAADARAAADAVRAGDRDRLRSLSADLAAAGERAGSAAADPTWAVAGAVPVFGDDVDAIGTVARSVDSLGAALAEPMTRLLDHEAAALDGASLAHLSPALSDAARKIADADTAVRRIDSSRLSPPVAAAVSQLREVLDPVRTTLADAAAASAWWQAIDSGAHSVLVLMQNSAELRTGGGITGSFIQLDLTEGRIRVSAQADSGAFPALTEPIVPSSAAQDALYGDVLGRFVQNASMPTDFAQTAELATAWWQRLGHPAPDAVIALDIPAIGALLAATGPVTLPDGTQLTADNIVQRMLIDPYLTLTSAQQTEFMQSAVPAALEGMSRTPPDLIRALVDLAGPIAQGRVSLWSADPSVQALLQHSRLGGPSSRIAQAGPDAFGVFFNDGTGGKMDIFLHTDIATMVASCRPDGRAEVVVRLTMRSDAPADAELVLPGDVTGRGLYGTGAGDIGTSVSVSAPPGSFAGGVTKDGTAALSVDVEDAGRPNSLVRVNLSPGEVNVVDFRFTMAGPGAVAPVIVATPLLNAPTITAAEPRCR